MSPALLPSSDSQRLPLPHSLERELERDRRNPRRRPAHVEPTHVEALDDEDDLPPDPLVEEPQPWDSGALLEALTELDIEFSCRSCGRPGRAPRAWAGGRVRCSRCRRPLRLPSEATAGFQDDEVRFGTVRRRTPARDLAHEAHLRAIALWHCLAGLLTALLAPALTRGESVELTTGVVLGATLVWGTGQLLWRLSPLARWSAGALAIGLAFGLAVGAVRHPLLPGAVVVLLAGTWAGGVMWAVLSQAGSALFAPAYRFAVERDRGAVVPWPSSPFFYLPAGLLLGSAVASLFLI